MTRTPRREDLEERLGDLETRFGFGPTHLVMLLPEGSTPPEDEHRTVWPDGTSLEDITVRGGPDSSKNWDGPDERVALPQYRPQQYRGGLVMMSEAEIAQVYDRMPADVRERERERRIENGEPVPPILQQ